MIGGVVDWRGRDRESCFQDIEIQGELVLGDGDIGGVGFRRDRESC